MLAIILVCGSMVERMFKLGSTWQPYIVVEFKNKAFFN